jgi:hypothetical protein
MHNWSDTKIDWKGIEDAARYIGLNLRRWGRVPVRDYKEKWGTARVYCSFGWYSIHDITHPGYAWIRYKRNGLMWHLNYARWISPAFTILNMVIRPYQQWLYTYFYGRALRKWPHLRLEILSGADYSELLTKYGVHHIRTSESGYEIYYDWSANDFVGPPGPKTIEIEYRDAEKAICTALDARKEGKTDEASFEAAMEYLGFDVHDTEVRSINNGRI